VVGLIAVAALFAVSAMGEQVRQLFGDVGEEMEVAAGPASGSGSEGDGDGNEDTANQAPATPGLSAASIQENNGIGDVVGTISATDPDGDTVTFSLAGGGDNDAFQILGNELRAGAAFDFESPQDADSGNTYDITIIATDDGSPQESSQANFTITVTDEAEPNQPPAAPSLSATSLQENNAAGAAVGTITAIDPEGDGVTFSLAGGGDNVYFQVVGNELRAVSPFNYEAPRDANSGNNYDITLIATDDGSPQESSQANFTILVTDDAVDTGPSGRPLCGGVFNHVKATNPVVGGPGCDDGTGAIYAGRAPDGTDFFAAHCDIGMNSTSGGCTGSRSSVAWAESVVTTFNNTNLPDLVSGALPNTAGMRNGSEVIAATTPQTITRFLAVPQASNADADAGEAGLQPHQAAKMCNDLTAHGRAAGSWYLPALGELDVIYANLAATDDVDHPLPSAAHSSQATHSGTTGPLRSSFSISATFYLASNEYNIASRAWGQRFTDGAQTDGVTKTTGSFVRCVTR
jgi:hypothetical protein